MGPDDITPPTLPSAGPVAPAAAPAGAPAQGQPATPAPVAPGAQSPAAPAAAPPAPAKDSGSNGAINSMEDAKSVARLIQEGKITGPGRDKALADLRAFDNSVEHEKNAKGKNAVESMGVGEKVARGFAAGATSVGHGVKQALVAADQELANHIPGWETKEQSAAEKAQQQKLAEQTDQMNKHNAPLLATKSGAVGNFLGQAATTAPIAAVPGADTALGAAVIGGSVGAVQPVGTKDNGRATNIAEGAIGGAAGQQAGKLVGYVVSKVASKIAPELIAAAVTPKGVTPEAAKAVSQGYRLPPSMAKANPSIVENLVEGMGGKVRTEQAFSIPNQANTNRLARSSIGLSAGDKISTKELLDQRKEAGKAYDEVRNLMDNAYPEFKNVRLKPDKEFQATMDNITGTFKNYARRFPSVFKNAQVDRMARDINKPMTTDEAVQLSMKLREDSTANYRAPKGTVKALGKAQKKAADAIDRLVESHLQKMGEPGGTPAMTQARHIIGGKDPSFQNIYNQYKKARQVIARTYDIEKVLDPHTGNVDAQALSRLARRRPLHAELKDIADFGGKYEGVARVPTRRGSRLGPEISKSEIGVAAVGGALGHPGGLHKLATIAAYTGLPAASRHILGSDLYQNSLRPHVPVSRIANTLKRTGGSYGAYTLRSEEKKKKEKEKRDE